MIRNGGTMIKASSGTLGMRSSGAAPTTSLATANRTLARLTWEYSDWIAIERDPYSSRVVSRRTRNSCSAWLRMSVTRRSRVSAVPRMMYESV